jgi:hypothetical protein
MTKKLKKLNPNVDELSTKHLNAVYGGAISKTPGGDKGDSNRSSNSGNEVCVCACKCNKIEPISVFID